MYKVLILGLIILLTGCVSEETKFNIFKQSTSTYCYEGVKYLFFNSGHKAGITAKINPETLTYERCGENE